MTPICTIEIYYNEDEVANSRVILDGKSTPICDLPARRVAEILHGLIDPRDGVLSGILKRPFDEKTPLMNMLIGVGIKRLMELVGETQADLQKEQQPVEWSDEVDFDAEYAKFHLDSGDSDDRYTFPIDLADYKDFARHFYNLGINAR